MADIGIADLLGIKKSIEENDIFNTISSSLLNFKPTTFGLIPGNQSAGVDPVAYSMPVGSQLASTFATALLGGLAHNYGKQQEAAQLKAVTDLLPSLIADPEHVTAPEGAGSAFELLRQTQIANKAEKASKMQDAKESAAFAALLSDPAKAITAKKLLGIDVPKLAGIEPKTTENNVTARPMTSSSLMDKYMEALEKTGGNEALALDSVKRELERPKELEDIAKNLRGELIGNSEIKAATTLGRLYSTLNELKGNPSAVADIPYLVGLIKAGDPGSVVSTKESGAVVESSGLPAGLVAQFNKYLSGKGNLPLRKDVLEVVKQYYSPQKKVAEDFLKNYIDLAERKGIDRRDINLIPKFPDILESAKIPIGDQASIEDQLSRLKSEMEKALENHDDLKMEKLRKDFEAIRSGLSGF